MSKIDVLEIHGTELATLKPRHVIQAAEADLKRISDNAVAFKIGDSCHPYAFHRRHVRKAATVVELIEWALKENELGCASGKRNTRMIYRNTSLLLAAREEA